ncbi:MAG: hypothetical protein WCL32_23765 [Planctomycetota bacterium]
MSHRFDATLKDIVAERPGDFADVFGLPKDELPFAINVDLSTISAATDVALGYGEPLKEIVDLNFQTGPDAALPRRLHKYNAAINERHNVSVESILILLRPKADAANLDGKLSYGRPGRQLQFEYGIVRLWQEPVENYLQAGIAALPLSTLCKMPEGQPLPEALRGVVREIDRRLGQETNQVEAARLMTAAYILTGLRVPKEDLASIYKGIGLMKESTAFDEAVEEGELKRSHRLLLRLGRKRFGNPDGTTEAALTAIIDLDRLERLADAILTASSWQELLATP